MDLYFSSSISLATWLVHADRRINVSLGLSLIIIQTLSLRLE